MILDALKLTGKNALVTGRSKVWAPVLPWLWLKRARM